MIFHLLTLANEFVSGMVRAWSSFPCRYDVVTLGICCSADFHSTTWDDPILKHFFFAIYHHLHCTNWPSLSLSQLYVRKQKMLIRRLIVRKH